MRAGIADPLLPPEAGAAEGECSSGAEGDAAAAGGVGSWSRRQRYLAAAALCLSGSGLLCLGATRTSRSTEANPLEYLSDLVAGWGDSTCYRFTGGTCMVFGCNEARGAICTNDHNCICASGCTGADGMCHQESYKLIASNIRLRNVKYSDQYVYTPRTWFMKQLRVTSAKGEYADLWNLYKLPGKDFINSNDMYFLSPVEFPEYVAGVPTSADLIPENRIFSVDVFHLSSRYLLNNRRPYDPFEVMSTLCRPRERPEAVQISGILGQATWFIHHASWDIVAWIESRPGGSGQWVPEPPINASFPFC